MSRDSRGLFDSAEAGATVICIPAIVLAELTIPISQYTNEFEGVIFGEQCVGWSAASLITVPLPKQEV